MAKCKVCGTQIPRGRIVCDECTEALRMKAPLPPNVSTAVQPSPATKVKIAKKGLELEHTSFPSLRENNSEIAKKLKKLASYPNVAESSFDYTNNVYKIKMDSGEEYLSADTEAWYKKGSVARTMMPWQKGDDPAKPWEMAQAAVMQGLMDDPYGDTVPTQRKIREITDAMKDLLLYKNQKYGDSAINPIEIFTKHLKNVDTKTAAILVRLDDKLSRVKNADTLRTNDICDLIGYLTLLNVALGTTAEDIAKFKD